MKKEILNVTYTVFESASEMEPGDMQLLEAARKITEKAYAPYSNFLVGAVAVMEDGSMVTGTNQENASYPVGICAERTLLSVAAMERGGQAITTIAVSYKNINGDSNKPISPCGMCRQALSEYETRGGKPIRIILGGQEGKVFVLESVGDLLPFSFGGADLK